MITCRYCGKERERYQTTNYCSMEHYIFNGLWYQWIESYFYTHFDALTDLHKHFLCTFPLKMYNIIFSRSVEEEDFLNELTSDYFHQKLYNIQNRMPIRIFLSYVRAAQKTCKDYLTMIEIQEAICKCLPNFPFKKKWLKDAMLCNSTSCSLKEKTTSLYKRMTREFVSSGDIDDDQRKLLNAEYDQWHLNEYFIPTPPTISSSAFLRLFSKRLGIELHLKKIVTFYNVMDFVVRRFLKNLRERLPKKLADEFFEDTFRSIKTLND